jgi:hypothetical protein
LLRTERYHQIDYADPALDNIFWTQVLREMAEDFL